LIVMKFGGSSVANAERILGVAEIVRDRLDQEPIVVLSALAGVTDLLTSAIATARGGDREALEPILGELERRHRWALTGTMDDAGARHDLSLQIDALFEELRQLLRSVRLLGEGTPRAADSLLAFGEELSTRIAAAAFADRGLPAEWVDPREVLITDHRHGAAEPDPDAVADRAERILVPRVGSGKVPVVGGFVGSTPEGVTTTLGRGGSDTSAAVLGCAVGAEEIQIWTDVDGLLTADPEWVPNARTLASVSFAEAAELAYYGARVLHPASIAPAVRRDIPVRILNSLNPDHPGTMIRRQRGAGAPALASVACRGGVGLVRISAHKMRVDPSFLPQVLERFRGTGVTPDLVVSSEVSVAMVVPSEPDLDVVSGGLAKYGTVERLPKRGILCVVGSGLAEDQRVRRSVLSAVAELEPDAVSLGGSATSVSAVVPEERLASSVRVLHERFFESRQEP
jgi:aspartate kinase